MSVEERLEKVQDELRPTRHGNRWMPLIVILVCILGGCTLFGSFYFFVALPMAWSTTGSKIIDQILDHPIILYIALGLVAAIIFGIRYFFRWICRLLVDWTCRLLGGG
jgi:hypothetical protein